MVIHGAPTLIVENCHTNIEKRNVTSLILRDQLWYKTAPSGWERNKSIRDFPQPYLHKLSEKEILPDRQTYHSSIKISLSRSSPTSSIHRNQTRIVGDWAHMVSTLLDSPLLSFSDKFLLSSYYYFIE